MGEVRCRKAARMAASVVLVVVLWSPCLHATSVLLRPDSTHFQDHHLRVQGVERQGVTHTSSGGGGGVESGRGGESGEGKDPKSSGMNLPTHPISPPADPLYGGGFFLDEFEAVTRSDTLECPSANVITTRYKCQVRSKWVDCFRRRCCQGYNFVAGRCLPDSVDPCTQNFCEQKCSVYFGRVICTCYSGYRFSPENHKRGIQPVCLDIDECGDQGGSCDHHCDNTPGSFKCSCRQGYILRGDNSTCELESEGGNVASPGQWTGSSSSESPHASSEPAHGPPQLVQSAPEPARRRHCSASCYTVGQMATKIRSLEEKVVALSTAVRLYSFAAGLPGPEGPPGPPGTMGPRGFPGPAGSPGPTGPEGPLWTPPPTTPQPRSPADQPFSGDDFPLDSWTMVHGGGRRKFCRCRRGPVGSPGATGKPGLRGLLGETGLAGERGPPGSFDFLNLMVADLRHDIQKLQEKVFKGDDLPEPYDLAAAVARGGEVQAGWQEGQYHTQLQELLTEEVDNRIFGAARRFQPHLLQLVNGEEEAEEEIGEGGGNKGRDGNADEEIYMNLRPNESRLETAGPIPPPRTLLGRGEDSNLGMTVRSDVPDTLREDDADSVSDDYYDTPFDPDDPMFEEYLLNYEYSPASEATYIFDYGMINTLTSSVAQPTTITPTRAYSYTQDSSITLLTPFSQDQYQSRHRSREEHFRGQKTERGVPLNSKPPIALLPHQPLPHTTSSSTLHSSADPDQSVGHQRAEQTNPLSPWGSEVDVRVKPVGDTEGGNKIKGSTVKTNYDDLSSSSSDHVTIKRGTTQLSGFVTDRSNDYQSIPGQINIITEEQRNVNTKSSSQEVVLEDEGNAGSFSSPSTTDRNRSRARETEKLIDILDDILREMEVTATFSRHPRNSHTPSVTGSATHPASISVSGSQNTGQVNSHGLHGADEHTGEGREG